MIDYVDIKLPLEAADNYYYRGQQDDIDSFIYLENEWYEKLKRPTTYFVLGPKGCGKTLFAAYMCSKKRDNIVSKSYTINVDDYGKLIYMKRNNHLQYTDYSTMWKVILLQKFLFGIQDNEISWINRGRQFSELQKALSSILNYDVTDDSFNPTNYISSYEKQQIISNCLNNEVAMGAEGKPLSASMNWHTNQEERNQLAEDTKREVTASVYTDTWMKSIYELKEALQNLSFNVSHYLFIDGLDVRPEGINADEYGKCISALVRAVHEIDTQIFGNLRNRGNKACKIIALTRTDIFINSQLVNATSLIHDNCVEFDWSFSNEREFNNSYLYFMMNRVLGWDEKQNDMPLDKYFDFDMSTGDRYTPASMYIQRLSRLRPRDIVVMFNQIQQECRKQRKKNPDASVLTSSSFHGFYSAYYENQIRSEMMFRYNQTEIDLIFEFLKTMKTTSINEIRFNNKFEQFSNLKPSILNLFKDHRELLDALYSLDIIGWTEKYDLGSARMTKTHWHYRERKAMTEGRKLPWDEIDFASDVEFKVHRGAGKDMIGINHRR